MKFFVCIYNPNSGGGVDKHEISRLFKTHSAKVEFVEISQGIGAVRKKIGNASRTVLIAAGGDGTVNLAASWAIQLNLPLAVLPVGTLNHFAKDAGLPLELEESVKVIVNPKVTKMDYCTVNKKVFVNNSSIGLYPSSVLWRESNDHKYGKWPAAVIAASRSLFRHKLISVTIETKGVSRPISSPLIFIGNNDYQVDKAGITNRESISGGKIFMYAICSNGPAIFIKRALMSTIGRTNHEEDFILRTSNPLTIKANQGKVNVAVDGEVIGLTFPLKYQIFSGGLNVCLPK